MPEAKTNDPIKDAAAKAAAEPKLEITYNTRFLSPPHEEIEAAAHWLRKRFPDLQEELLNECLADRLNLDGFNKGTVVYVLARKSYGREIKIYGPVYAKDHWMSDERGWNSELNRGSFLSEIAKMAAPWAIVQPDAASKKNGELPKFAVLSSC